MNDEHGFSYQWSYTRHPSVGRSAVSLTVDVTCNHEQECDPYDLVDEGIEWAGKQIKRDG